MCTHRLVITCLIPLLFSTHVLANDAITINPGMWEITTRMTSPMSPSPRTQTSQECITENLIRPSDLAPQESGECQITQTKVSGNSLNWTMQCNTPGGKMSGEGQFTSHGNTGSGKMTMNMNIEGQSFSMQMSWEGKRTGDC